MYVYFEWNQDKNHSNQRKHRVSFEIAQRVFLDPNHLAVLERIEDGEERWQTIGIVGSCLLLLVAHTTIETDVEGDTVEIVRIISARKADAKERGEDMKRKNSAKNLAHRVLPPLTEEQKAQIASLSALPDEGIDYADAPALGEETWQTAVQGRFYKPMKVSKTIRIDADVLAWLQRPGKGYQKRLNAVLREAMLKEHEHEE